ncbi:MAG: HEPN domain-containing protein [bacterium]|nr:HEPN domain-containing protein [bacterium]
MDFPKTHDLGELLDLLTSVEAPLAEPLKNITDLDPYSVQARYPGDLPAVSREEAEEAERLTREVRDQVSAVLTAYLGPAEGSDTSHAEGSDTSQE